jgi:hypothetical protein
MELLVMIDALRRASAARITAVLPYFGYARQDRRVRSARVPISAKVVADMMVSVGVDRVLTVDLHAEQIQGFFGCPVDNVYGSPVLKADILACNYDNLIVVSPDIGGVVRARAIAKQLDDADLAIIDKRRPQANEAQVMNLIGEVDGSGQVAYRARPGGSPMNVAVASARLGTPTAFLTPSTDSTSRPEPPIWCRMGPGGGRLGWPPRKARASNMVRMGPGGAGSRATPPRAGWARVSDRCLTGRNVQVKYVTNHTNTHKNTQTHTS